MDSLENGWETGDASGRDLFEIRDVSNIHRFLKCKLIKY
jgi:hypothetical protein